MVGKIHGHRADWLASVAVKIGFNETMSRHMLTLAQIDNIMHFSGQGEILELATNEIIENTHDYTRVRTKSYSPI